MAQSRLSRRKIAVILADELIAGRNDIVQKLAAYLIETKRTRELSLYVRDIESALSERGVLLADVSSCHELDSATQQTIVEYLSKINDTRNVHLRMTIDNDLLGGVKIETPDKRLDATLRHRINQLTASKI